MWLISIISLALLPGSFAAQDEFRSLGNGYPIGSETLADGGRYQSAAPPNLQVLSSPEGSSGFDPGCRITEAGDHLLELNAPSYPLDTVGTQWKNFKPPSPKYLTNDFPQGEFSQAPGPLSYPASQQSKPASKELPTYVLNPAHSQNLESHTGLSESEREALELIDWDTIYWPDEATGDFLPDATSLAHGPSPNFASEPHLAPHLVISPSWTEIFRGREPGPEPYLPSPTPGSSTGFSRISMPDNELDQVESQSLSDNQPREVFQGVSMVSKKKRKNVSRKEFHQRVEGDQIGKTTARSSFTNTKDNSSYKSKNDVSSNRAARAPKFTPPNSEEIREVQASSPYALMTDLATRLQRSSAERMIMIEQTALKWFPVYKKMHFESDPRIKTKLATLFEQLWHMNTWLLYSYQFESLENTKYLHFGHDCMMSWVVHQMLHPDEASPVLGPKLPSSVWTEDDVRKNISYFLGAEKQTEAIWVIKKKSRPEIAKPVRIEKEYALACELAVCVLEAYYKSSNPARYMKVFGGKMNIRARLLKFTKAKDCCNLDNWKKRDSSTYGTIILPWAQVEFSAEEVFQKDEWGASLQRKFEEICQERLEELDQQARDRRIPAKQLRRKKHTGGGEGGEKK